MGCRWSRVQISPPRPKFKSVVWPQLARKKPSRILVVDDEPDSAEVIAVALRPMGHIVEVVIDSSETLKRAREFSPDIVFLDLAMPIVDGFTVAKALRAEFGPDALSIIAVSGRLISSEDRIRSRQAGVDAHVAKPLDAALLEHVLDVVASKDSRAR
jgi:CheY-like chemotaxis protein